MDPNIYRGSRLLLSLGSGLVAAVLALPVSALAYDEVGTGTAEQPRDIAISMDDTLRFDPAEVTVGAGEVVRFVLTNTGAATHDFVIGDLETQEEHGAQMAAGDMHMHGACPESEDDHGNGAMAEDDMVMGGDGMASQMPEEDDADEHMDDADEHMDDADEHMDDADEHSEAALCPGGIPGPVTIEPGKTVTVLARFDEPGQTLYGCHQPGHWEVGMKGTITIVDTTGTDPLSSPAA